MSFKKFRADVSAAGQKAAAGGIPGVLAVTNGESDGEVVIKYHHDSLAEDVRIQALAQDVSAYPDGNMFMLWTTDDSDPPQPVVDAVKATQDYLLGLSVYEMIIELASRLNREITRLVDGDSDSQSEEAADDEEEDDYDAAYDADYPSDGEQFGLASSAPRLAHRVSGPILGPSKPMPQRIKRDLRQVKHAGYKVGFLDAFGKTSSSGLISISVRLDKLALSEEAMEAWDVKPTEYVVLLLRFERQYDPLERVIEQPAVHTEVKFRIGKCNRYKPSLSQAIAAFVESNRSFAAAAPDPGAEDSSTDEGNFEKLFVSNSLDSFMCESFVSLLKIREAQHLDWESANEFLLRRIGLFNGTSNPLPGPASGLDQEQTPQLSGPTRERQHVLGADHLLEKHSSTERSFPLVAMQFAMRYFVKCTEYCLRCHRRLEKGFEALRPYVCSDPLCLFQYMAMGLGPSIEHEILTEPYVVDLLVSLCYAATQHTNYRTATESKLSIRALPVGLRLRVPDLTNSTAKPLKARVTPCGTRLVFENEGAKGFGERLAPAQWLAFRKTGHSVTQHARIEEVDGASNTIIIEAMGEPSAPWTSAQYYGLASSYGQANPYGQAPNPSVAEGGKGPERADIADVFLYDTDFDSMADNDKSAAMRQVLDTLPSILDIEEWLTSHPHSTIRSMKRVSPAAASLLQWIVSSNRSCIFQVDRSRAVARQRAAKSNGPSPPLPAEAHGVAGKGRNREHERILGMDGWVQFRFAQGSPDKEMRFNRALQEVAARKSIHAHPTIFAWHGSNLANWHSIVRTGLDFKDVACGRAYGNGVYFSPNFVTSVGYTNLYSGAGLSWPNSDLNISTCLSLNEIINAPDEFVSRAPHYVVSQLDWHQCRYLFVQTGPGAAALPRVPPTSATSTTNNGANSHAYFPLAPGLEVIGKDGQPLRIPLSAIPLRTIGSAAGAPLISVKRTVQLLEVSDDEDPEDVEALFTDDESEVGDGPPTKKTASPDSSMDNARAGDGGAGPPTPASIGNGRSMTDFEPGSLDLSTLQRLKPPSFATDAGTKSLSRELVRLQTVQSSTPLHELGWYMDFEHVSNLYQWIVQLHSFDPALPLAQDMKKAGITSIVLELRFGQDFPFSPPFVRVVRPRFLPFLSGGGGHVTAGGAMCMELLTSSGWSPATSLECVFLQVRMALCSLEPRPARLYTGVTMDYGIGEAIEAYLRAARTHGWVVPEKLHLTANGI